VRTRPCSVFGRPVHLSGLLPLITTGGSPQAFRTPPRGGRPAPPKIRRWRLQVSLSVSRLSPSCLTSLSIPFHPLRAGEALPPPLDISPGLGLSGTSTHLTRQLSGTHYGPLRHPSAPGLSLTGVRLIIPDHALGLPVLRALSLCTCCRHYPGAAAGRIPRSSHPAVSAFPGRGRRVGLHIDLFEACSAFTRVAACTLARSPYFVTRLSEGFRHFVASMPASGCFRLERLPGGACTHWKAPPCHGAPPKPDLHDLASG